MTLIVKADDRVAVCLWRLLQERDWVSECGMSHSFRDIGGPKTYDFYYCPNCGKPLEIYEPSKE